MKEELVGLLQDQESGQAVELIVFERATDSVGDATVTEGLLYVPTTGAAFPIIHGVPVMIAGAFPPAFLEKYRSAIDAVRSAVPLRQGSGAADDFSFSTQWEAYFARPVGRTWGYTVAERVEQFLMEMQVDREWCRGKRILDGGCGPAGLSEGIAALGSDVLGFDYSSAVYEAERRRQTRSLQFVALLTSKWVEVQVGATRSYAIWAVTA